MRCVLSSAIVTWRNCSSEEQHWKERQSRLLMTVERATQATCLVVEQLNREPSTRFLVQGKPAVTATLALLADIASLVRDETTASKAVACAVISPWIEPTLALLSYYIADRGENFSFYHTSIESQSHSRFSELLYRDRRSCFQPISGNIRQCVEPDWS